MTAFSQTLALRHVYRDDGAGTKAAARPHLEAAADALAMALLCLEDGDAHGDRRWRAEQARGLLADAVISLSRARIYNPRIRTLALPLVMATEVRPEAELSRLHHIATRLLFQNHEHLPARLQAMPLGPEDEAQLAVVVRELGLAARLGQALRHRWAFAALGVTVAGPLLGAPLLGAAAAVGTVVAGLLRSNGNGDDEAGHGATT
ncbi:hypothetical protein [Paraliomyxa miuraensis]|uniref:hypothetical protein n=1 Tax=Paraliomyxa miuraensis TaxID=376150 RepID=UPI00225885A7|nr:hypothetical protein [Paraliomyxa miuraensis]MCX4245581.1 hypothetical protein [Paraliomyxa miuraensis]